jgi:hypothetical protein
MKPLTVAVLTALLLISAPSFAKDVAGVQVPETVTVQDTALPLNGAGIRSRFFVKVYVGALYLKNRETTTPAVLAAPPPKSVRLHFIYDEVTADKLVGAWNDGFTGNNTPEELNALKPRIEQFNAMFPTVRKGDTLRIDLLTDGSTEVWFKDAKRGAVPGADFQKALLKIWLGEKPADASLKDAMLGGK